MNDLFLQDFGQDEMSDLPTSDPFQYHGIDLLAAKQNMSLQKNFEQTQVQRAPIKQIPTTIQFASYRELGGKNSLSEKISLMKSRKNEILNPSTKLSNRHGYVFSINSRRTIKAVFGSKDSNVTSDKKNGLFEAKIQGRGFSADIYEGGQCQQTECTFFAVKFGSGSGRLTIEWNETPGEPTILCTKLTGKADNHQERNTTEVSSIAKHETGPATRYTNALVLVPSDNFTLWNSVCGALKSDYAVIKANHEQMLVRTTSRNPLDQQVVLAFAYNEDNTKELRAALSCTDNIILFGTSAEPYLLKSLAFQGDLISLFDPMLNPQQWPQRDTHRSDLCHQSARVLDLIRRHGKLSLCCALMVPPAFTLISQTLNRVIPMFDSSPITTELYVLWKFTGLEGLTEEDYCLAVTNFVQYSGIPATVDTACRGCIAVIMHGPRWLWWYLQASKDTIKTRFGSDLRSITEIGCSNVTELAKRKDNARFKNDLHQLHQQMRRDNVPDGIKNKLSIIFKSLERRQSNLQCIHKHSSQMTHNLKEAEAVFNLKSADRANGADEILVNNTKAIIHQRATSHQRGIAQLSYHDSQALEDFDRARKIEPNFTFQDRGKVKRLLDDINGTFEDLNIDELNSNMVTKLIRIFKKHLMKVKELRGSITCDELIELENCIELCLTKLTDELFGEWQKIYDELELPTRLWQNFKEMQTRKVPKNIVLGGILGGAGMLTTSMTATPALGGAGCCIVAGIAFPPVLVLSETVTAIISIVTGGTRCTNSYQLSRENARLDRHNLKSLLDMLQRVLQQQINTRDNPRVTSTIQRRWQEDSEVSTCNSCQATFHFFRRKHHCRICLKIFCDSCSQYRVELEGNPVKVRACLQCASSKSEDRFCEM